MSDILVVGSLAYDTISSPEGKAERCLGGSANYFSMAAHRRAKVRVVGVVGEDYAPEHLDLLKNKNVDVDGLQVQQGKTFCWEGEYKGDMNEAHTLNTELNVFESFDPKIPDSYKHSSFVFLANIDPSLQLKVMEQVSQPKLVASDTMNLWIDIKKEELLKVVSKVDLLIINDAKVKDPTGAGDTFAGAFFGHLSTKENPLEFSNLKEAAIQGTVFASFTVQDFGLNHIAELPEDSFEQRLREFKEIISL